MWQDWVQGDAGGGGSGGVRCNYHPNVGQIPFPYFPLIVLKWNIKKNNFYIPEEIIFNGGSLSWRVWCLARLPLLFGCFFLFFVFEWRPPFPLGFHSLPFRQSSSQWGVREPGKYSPGKVVNGGSCWKKKQNPKQTKKQITHSLSSNFVPLTFKSIYCCL